MRTLHVELGERSYPIYIGAGILNTLGELSAKHGITRKSPHLIVTDDQVAPHYLAQVEEQLNRKGTRSYPISSLPASPPSRYRSMKRL